MSLSVTLEKFEGPLDLLLHLIEKNKINIYDIPIVEITEQYMDYIRQMQEQDMEVMSEFLVMAATLLNIKSKMLLPEEEPEDTEEPVDPRQELVERLLQYKMYKYASLELSDLILLYDTEVSLNTTASVTELAVVGSVNIIAISSAVASPSIAKNFTELAFTE